MRIDYRREIDGLRAVAVLPVILFHAGFQTFSGGFVGVDVFFVISGFLITSIIIADLKTGKFSLLHFYERRARRILPALLLVMLASLPVACMWLLPTEMERFSLSLAATSLFSSNILFLRESDYFDTASELKPLLHTWSLAIEEQYYLLFPVLLMLAWRFTRSWIFLAIALVAAGSLLLSTRIPNEESFYLLPARGWELLIGALAAFYIFKRGKGTTESHSVKKELLSIAGLLLIVYAVLAYDRTTPFPGLYALIPAVGTVLIILFGTSHTLTGKLLSTNLLVGVGLISYSLYLWHQPVLAFARNRSMGALETYDTMLLLLGCLVLAYLSWRFVETPFRNPRTISRSTLLMSVSGGTAFFVLIGLVGYSTDWLSQRLPPNITWENLGHRVTAEGYPCRTRLLPGLNAKACYFGATISRRVVALYGDSHADALFAELDRAFKAQGIKGMRVKEGQGCNVVPQTLDSNKGPGQVQRCLDSFQDLLRLLESEAEAIVIASRWTFQLFPTEGAIEEMGFDNGEGGIERADYREVGVLDKNGIMSFKADDKRRALKHLITSMLATRKDVVLVYPVPEVGWNIAKLNFFHYHANNAILPVISTSHERFQLRNAFVISVFDEIGEWPNLHRVKPHQILCNTYIKKRCVVQFDGVPFYYDDDHLSDVGAKLVVSEVLAKLAGRQSTPSASRPPRATQSAAGTSAGEATPPVEERTSNGEGEK